METQVSAKPLSTIKDSDLQKITPFLWFDNQALDAANFYASVFKNARVKTTTRYSKEGAAASGVPEGSIMTVSFEIEGQEFTAMNGGPVFRISPAISFMVNCRTREKVDDLWVKLSEGGKVMMDLDKYPFSERYGWVEDKFGVSWQIILGKDTQIIAPCLMFTKEQCGKAEEAINYYMSLFKNSSVETVQHYEAGEEGPTGAVKYAAFTINGQNFKAMDSGIDVPFAFTPAISFVVNCDTQQQIDYYWDKLTRGGDETAQQCGWLKDKYEVSWQIVPVDLGKMLSDPDPEKSRRVLAALIPMKKLDLNVLQRAYEGNGEEEKDILTPKEEL